jgi:hypothetical protein
MVRQGRLFAIESGPEPSGRLEVMASAVQIGLEWQGHELEPWLIDSRTDAQTRCRLCGAKAWATSRKRVAPWSDHPGVCPATRTDPAVLRARGVIT